MDNSQAHRELPGNSAVGNEPGTNVVGNDGDNIFQVKAGNSADLNQDDTSAAPVANPSLRSPGTIAVNDDAEINTAHFPRADSLPTQHLLGNCRPLSMLF